MNTHFVHTTHIADMNFDSEIGQHHIFTDTTEDNGGKDAAPGPKKLMLTSLAGCTGIDIVSLLNKMRANFSNFSIDITATLSEDHPKIYTSVSVQYNISLSEEDKSKMEKAVNLSEEKYCGVMAMFKSFAKVETKISYLPLS